MNHPKTGSICTIPFSLVGVRGALAAVLVVVSVDFVTVVNPGGNGTCTLCAGVAWRWC